MPFARPPLAMGPYQDRYLSRNHRCTMVVSIASHYMLVATKSHPLILLVYSTIDDSAQYQQYHEPATQADRSESHVQQSPENLRQSSSFSEIFSSNQELA